MGRVWNEFQGRKFQKLMEKSSEIICISLLNLRSRKICVFSEIVVGQLIKFLVKCPPRDMCVHYHTLYMLYNIYTINVSVYN